ncbi:MAG: ELWxxDGT repeat protein, partial [Prochlorococcaceae cyanobacterium]
YYLYLPNGSFPADFTAVGNLVFFSANDGTNGRELWVSDGTTTGTHLVADITPGVYASTYPQHLTAFGNRLFFTANDGTNGTELWVSDGTAAGTHLLADIQPGSYYGNDPKGSYPGDFTAVGNLVFFSANDGANGGEIWASDGTTAGTLLVADIRPGADSSFPSQLTVSGQRLVFAADDGRTGTEIWSLDVGWALAATRLNIGSISGSQPEGDSGPSSFSFTIERSGDTTGSTTVSWAVSGTGNHQANGTDFMGGVLPSGTELFGPGETSRTFFMSVAGDLTSEPHETFRVSLSNPSAGAGIQCGSADAVIINDDPIADLVINAATAPSTAVAGTTITLSWSVGNIGTQATGGGWLDQVYLSLDGQLSADDIALAGGSVSHPGLAEGGLLASGERSVSLAGISVGGWQLIFRTDAGDTVLEASETNNELARPLTVLGTIAALSGVVTSSLDSNDTDNPARPGCYSEDYLITGITPGMPIEVSLDAGFDAYLQIVDASSQSVIAEDDDSGIGGSGLNSLLTFMPSSGITYLARATSFATGATGAFTLNTRSPFSVVEPIGNAHLLRRSDDQAVVQAGGSLFNVASPWSSPVGSSASLWQMLAAETIGGINRILWRNNNSNYFHFWTLDSGWGWLSSEGYIPVTSPQAWELESSFQIDLNADGTIGDRLTSIEAKGNAALVAGSDGQAYVRVGEAQYAVDSPWGGPLCTYANQWEMLAAETLDGTNRILWRNNAEASLHLWTVDDRWDWLSSNETVPLHTPEADLLAARFQVDPGPGPVFPQVITTIEGQGNAALLQEANGRLLVEAGGSLHPVGSPWGATSGTNGSAWRMIGAETLTGTNTSLWHHGPANFFHLWTLDATWNWQSSEGMILPDSVFGQELPRLFDLPLPLALSG